MNFPVAFILFVNDFECSQAMTYCDDMHYDVLSCTGQDVLLIGFYHDDVESRGLVYHR